MKVQGLCCNYFKYSVADPKLRVDIIVIVVLFAIKHTATQEQS